MDMPDQVFQTCFSWLHYNDQRLMDFISYSKYFHGTFAVQLSGKVIFQHIFLKLHSIHSTVHQNSVTKYMAFMPYEIEAGYIHLIYYKL